MELPKEALYNVFLNLPLEELKENCFLNKRANSICQSKAFWQEYGNKNYWLKLPNDLALKEANKIVEKADKILKYIRQYKLLLKYDSYLYMVFVMKDKDVRNMFLGNAPPGMFEEPALEEIVSLPNEISQWRWENKYNYTWTEGPKLEPGNNFIMMGRDEILGGRGERNYQMIWNNITKPTLYTNGQELIIIDFDVDFDYYKYENQDEQLFEMILDERNRLYDRMVNKYL